MASEVTSMTEVAVSYLEAGLSVLPIRSSDDASEAKRPALAAWGHLAEKQMSQDQARELFAGVDRIAVIAGNVSGNLEILDFDAPELCARWFKQVQATNKELADSLYIEASPSGGHHVLYRCAQIGGNAKLAMRPTHSGQDTLIETRGEGGYCLVAPTAGYEPMRGGLPIVPMVSPEQREIMFALAAQFDEREPGIASPAKARPSTATPGLRPGDDYNRRGCWHDLLTRHGWEFAYRRSRYDYYRRPGKASGVSASVVWDDDDAQGRLVVFSTSTDFETCSSRSDGASYSLFAAYAVLDHGGDFAAAAKALADRGYGSERPEATNEDDRVEIEYRPEDLHQMVQQCIEVLSERNHPPRWFVRNRSLVRVHESEEEPAIVTVNATQLAQVISGFVKMYRTKKGKDGVERVYIAVPQSVIQGIHQREAFPGIPTLSGMVSCPQVLQDGTIQADHGYIPELRLWNTSEGVTVPRQVTTEELGKAIDWIDDILIDFPFADPSSRANAFAAILTPILKPYIGEATPFLRIEATQQGTGKSALAKAIMAFTYPARVGATDYSKDEAEFAKKLQAMVTVSRPFIWIDNVVGRVQNQMLDSLITERKIEFRKLGDNTCPVVADCHAEIILTANNCSLSKDLSLRGYTIFLDANCANPESRTGFKHSNPSRHVQQHRDEAVRAALTIIRWWMQQGRPECPEMGRLIRFDAWARVLGGVLAAANIEGFLANQRATVESADPEQTAWQAFVRAWYHTCNDEPVRLKPLLDLAFGPKSGVGPRDHTEGLLTEFFSYAKGDQSLLSALAKRLPKGVIDIGTDGQSHPVRIRETMSRGHKHYQVVSEEATSSHEALATSVEAVALVKKVPAVTEVTMTPAPVEGQVSQVLDRELEDKVHELWWEDNCDPFDEKPVRPQSDYVEAAKKALGR